MALAEAGIHQQGTLEACDGQEGWHKLQQAHREGLSVDLVICDWSMPKVSGMDFLGLVRADERFREIPFLMVIPEGQRASMEQARRAGASDILARPQDFRPTILKTKIQRAIGP